MKSRDNLLPEPTCAFLRHAFGCFYDAFSQIDLANRPFIIHTLVFHERNPPELPLGRPVRYAYTIRLLYLKRRFYMYTLLKSKVPPAEGLKHAYGLRFASLVTINALDYKFKLHHSLPESARRPRSSGSPLLHPLPHTRHSRPASATLKRKTSTSPPSPPAGPTAVGRLSDHPPLRGRPRRLTP